MLLIKRYPNRKLYDTRAKRYVSLDDIADLVAGGVELTIRDAASGDDLTTLTLAQIVMERERAARGFLPRGLFLGLVQASEEALRTTRKIFPRTTYLWEVVNEEINRRMARLVRRGVVDEKEATRIETLLLKEDEVDRAVDNTEADTVRRAPRAGTIDALGVATRDDIAAILAQVDELSAQIDALADERRSESLSE